MSNLSFRLLVYKVLDNHVMIHFQQSDHDLVYDIAKHFRYCFFLFFQVVNTNFEVRNRRRVTRPADNANSPNFSGNIIIRDAGGNIESAVSYTIPRQALLIAQSSNPNFTGQYSVLYFAQNLFPSDLNISQVIRC